jgi:predicted dehydrogenase
MKKMRVGIIGMGNMGTSHAKYLYQNEVDGAELTAICDERVERQEWVKDNLPRVAIYSTVAAMLESGLIDGVLIATPHYSHPELTIQCLESGLHVMIEKPAGVYTKEVRRMNEAADASGKVFAIVYNQRTNPLYQKLRELVASGELGEIRRTNWIITSWYRSQSYYDSGGWRATWEGEGGGVLINQCPHQLDLWQWTTGLMPKRMRAFCQFGKHRNIEVENDVTAYVEYENGATGVFITNTTEPAGTNRYEIVGDRGKVVVENNEFKFWRFRISEPEFNATYKGGFGEPEVWKCEIPIEGKETGHKGIVQDWVNGVVKGTTLLAPGTDGIKGLTISNAMLLSTWTDGWVDLPLDEDLFYEQLQDKIRLSTTNKQKSNDKTLDI